MKKSLFVLILIGGWVIPSWAQNNKEFEQLCKKYQDSENVGSFGMDGFGCLLASWFIGKEANDINALIRQCSSFRILSCSGEESKMLCKDIRAFVRASKLEELISVQEDGSEVKLYMQTVKNKVHQVFVSVVDEEQEVVFLQVKGKFDLAAIQKLAKTSQISYLCH